MRAANVTCTRSCIYDLCDLLDPHRGIPSLSKVSIRIFVHCMNYSDDHYLLLSWAVLQSNSVEEAFPNAQ